MPKRDKHASRINEPKHRDRATQTLGGFNEYWQEQHPVVLEEVSLDNNEFGATVFVLWSYEDRKMQDSGIIGVYSSPERADRFMREVYIQY